MRGSCWPPTASTKPHTPPHITLTHLPTSKMHARQARATDGTDPCAVLPGSYVTVVLSGVPASAAAALCASVSAAAAGAPSGGALPPPLAFGLLQHETKLSVVHFSVKRAAGFGAAPGAGSGAGSAAASEPLRNKEPLLLVTGLRSFMARPVFSADEHGADKYKMERFLHEGRQSVASVSATL